MMASNMLDSLYKMRTGFMREGLEPPALIFLKNRNEGLRFLAAVRASPSILDIANPQDLVRLVIASDSSAWMECEVMEIKVRWPAAMEYDRYGAVRYV